MHMRKAYGPALVAVLTSLLIPMMQGWAAGTDRDPAGKSRDRERPSIEQLIHRADSDKDGSVTYDEVKAVAPRVPEALFKRWDEDKDGRLEKGEGPGARKDGDGFQSIFKRADTDGDKKVTREELASLGLNGKGELFSRLDKNNDGVLTLNEFTPESSGMNRGVIRRADANQDRQVTREELAQVAPRLAKEQFDKMDKNHDGVLTREDARQMRPESGLGVPDDGQMFRRNRGGADALGTSSRAVGDLLDADANGDGQVDLDELQQAKPGFPKKTFDRLDRNGDGMLSDADKAEAGKSERTE